VPWLNRKIATPSLVIGYVDDLDVRPQNDNWVFIERLVSRWSATTFLGCPFRGETLPGQPAWSQYVTSSQKVLTSGIRDVRYIQIPISALQSTFGIPSYEVFVTVHLQGVDVRVHDRRNKRTELDVFSTFQK